MDRAFETLSGSADPMQRMGVQILRAQIKAMGAAADMKAVFAFVINVDGSRELDSLSITSRMGTERKDYSTMIDRLGRVYRDEWIKPE